MASSGHRDLAAHRDSSSGTPITRTAGIGPGARHRPGRALGIGHTTGRAPGLAPHSGLGAPGPGGPPASPGTGTRPGTTGIPHRLPARAINYIASGLLQSLGHHRHRTGHRRAPITGIAPGTWDPGHRASDLGRAFLGSSGSGGHGHWASPGSGTSVWAFRASGPGRSAIGRWASGPGSGIRRRASTGLGPASPPGGASGHRGVTVRAPGAFAWPPLPAAPGSVWPGIASGTVPAPAPARHLRADGHGRSGRRAGGHPAIMVSTLALRQFARQQVPGSSILYSGKAPANWQYFSIAIRQFSTGSLITAARIQAHSYMPTAATAQFRQALR